MEGMILVGLVAFVALTVGLLMYRLRGGSTVAPPVWLLSALLALILVLVVVAMLARSWLNVATFSVLAVMYGAMLLSAIRARRSA